MVLIASELCRDHMMSHLRSVSCTSLVKIQVGGERERTDAFLRGHGIERAVLSERVDCPPGSGPLRLVRRYCLFERAAVMSFPDQASSSAPINK